jgi:hypothetical protein
MPSKEADRMTSAGPSSFRFERAVWAAYALVWLLWYALVFALAAGESTEQLTTGNLAQGLVDGLVASPWSYQHQAVGRGPLLYGVLLYPLYKIAGSYLLWLKLLAGLFAAGATALWIYVVRKAWGFTAGLMFALWWLAAPPLVAYILHVAYANHMESIFWSGLLAALFVNENRDPPRRVRIGLAAFIAGFASFFCGQNLAFSAALFVVAVIRWRKSVGRVLLVAPPLFLLGYALHFLRKIQTGETIRLIARHPHPWQQWRDLVTKYWFAAPGYSLHAASAAVGALLALGVAAAVWRFVIAARRPPIEERSGFWLGRLLLLQIGFYFVAYGFSEYYIPEPGFSYNYRYLAPIFPSLLALVCQALSQLPRHAGWLMFLPKSQWRRYAGWLILIPVLVVGAYDAHPVRSMIDAGQQWRKGLLGWDLLSLRGDDFGDFVKFNLSKDWGNYSPHTGDQKTIAAISTIEKLPRQWRELGFETLGIWLGDDGGLDALLRGVACPPAYCKNFAVGVGEVLQIRFYGDQRDAITMTDVLRRIALWQDQAPELSSYYLRGIGRQWITMILEAKPSVREELTPFFVGRKRWSLNAYFADDTTRKLLSVTQDLIRALSPGQRVVLAAGVGDTISQLFYRGADEISFPAFLGFAGTQEEIAAYRQTFSETYAFQVMGTRNRLLLPLPVADPNAVRQYLLNHGIRVTPI